VQSPQLQPPLRKVLRGPLRLLELQVSLRIAAGRHHASQLLNRRNHRGLTSPEHPQKRAAGEPASNPASAPGHGGHLGRPSKGFCTRGKWRGCGRREQQAAGSSAACPKPRAPQPAPQHTSEGLQPLQTSPQTMHCPTCRGAMAAQGPSPPPPSTKLPSIAACPQVTGTVASHQQATEEGTGINLQLARPLRIRVTHNSSESQQDIPWEKEGCNKGILTGVGLSKHLVRLCGGGARRERARRDFPVPGLLLVVLFHTSPSSRAAAADTGTERRGSPHPHCAASPFSSSSCKKSFRTSFPALRRTQPQLQAPGSLCTGSLLIYRTSSLTAALQMNPLKVDTQ